MRPDPLHSLRERILAVANRERPARPSVAALFDKWLEILEIKGSNVTEDEIQMMESVLSKM